LNQFYQLPIYADGGTPGLSKVVPFTVSYGKVGVMNASGNVLRYKWMEIQEDVVSQDQYNKALKTFQEAAAKAEVKDEKK
jgi:oligopeptide transport system substrate-binding protein